MSNKRPHRPQNRLANIRSLGLFVVTVVFAVLQEWTAADVAWSMWVASLVGGYVYMGYMLGSDVGSFKKSDLPPNFLASIFILCLLVFFGLFTSVFLLFHFTGFHIGHAAFLSFLLPMSQIDVVALDDPLAYGFGLTKFYWPFALLVIVHTGFKIRESNDKITLATPYFSVMKNHILIFIVAVLQAFETPILLFYILLFYYFFPVRDSWALLKSYVQSLRN